MNSLSNTSLSTAQLIGRAERTLANCEAESMITTAIEFAQSRPGRPREISVKAYLVALLVLGQEGRMHLIRVVRLLNQLDAPTRRRLGITRTEAITRRQVENIHHVITRALEAKALREGKTKWESLDELADMLLVASAHPEVEKSTSIAIDGTTIDSWGTRRRRHVVLADGSTVLRPVSTDPDAKWRAKGADAWKRPVFGYEVTAAVSVPDQGKEPVPLAALSIRFRPATVQTVEMGLSVAASVALWRGTLGDVLVDREYTRSIAGEEFILPIRALGGETVIDLTSNQLGATGTLRGAVIIDGHPFSPTVPEALRYIVPPAVGASSEELNAYQERIAARSVYAMKLHSIKNTGARTYMCPAAAGQVICPLMKPKKQAKRGRLPVRNVPTSVMPGDICSNAYTTFAPDELPLAQRQLFGSKDWFFSYSRRSRVEGYFGNLKNEANENARRGSIRVRGGMSTGLLVIVMAVATNLRLAEAWDRGSGRKKAPKPTMGRPRKQTLLPSYEIALSAGKGTAPPKAS